MTGNNYVFANNQSADYPFPVKWHEDERAGKKIGSNLRRLLADSQVENQNALADALGVPSAKISDLFRGRYNSPNVAFLASVAVVLRCSLHDVFIGVSGYRGASQPIAAANSGASQHGGSPDAEARIRELEELVSRYRDTVNALQPVTEELVHIVGAGAKDFGIGATSPKRRRRH